MAETTDAQTLALLEMLERQRFEAWAASKGLPLDRENDADTYVDVRTDAAANAWLERGRRDAEESSQALFAIQAGMESVTQRMLQLARRDGALASVCDRVIGRRLLERSDSQNL